MKNKVIYGSKYKISVFILATESMGHDVVDRF